MSKYVHNDVNKDPPIRKTFYCDGQTNQAKASSQPVNLPGAWLLCNPFVMTEFWLHWQQVFKLKQFLVVSSCCGFCFLSF